MNKFIEKYNSVYKFLRDNKLSGAYQKIKYHYLPQDFVYRLRLYKNTLSQEKISNQRKMKFDYEPKFSILIDTFGIDHVNFEKFLQSVYLQTYDNYELFIFLDSKVSRTSSALSALSHKYLNDLSKCYAIKQDGKVSFQNKINSILQKIQGEYVLFLRPCDVLSQDSLFEIVKALQNNKFQVAYADNDYIKNDAKLYSDPFFKPDWSPDLLRSYNYFGNFLLISKDILENNISLNDNSKSAYFYDLSLRCTKISNNIYHFSKIMYHERILENDNKNYYEDCKSVLVQFLIDEHKDANVVSICNNKYNYVSYKITSNPKVSVLIPNKNNISYLNKCIDSIYKLNSYNNIEIIVCDNASNQKEAIDGLEALNNKYANLSVLHYDKVFNYSKINNFLVEHANGEYILFLNSDTELIDKDSIKEMLGYCMREDIAAVGAKLLYEDDTIQHAGVVIGWGNAARHVFQNESKNSPAYNMQPHLTCNYSAVTAACMMTKKSLFEKVGGFDEDFSVAFNDVDLCLKLQKLNKFIVYNPFSVWRHYESKIRGKDDFGKNYQRFVSEKHMLIKKWPKIFKCGDPYYNCNFSYDLEPYKFKY